MKKNRSVLSVIAIILFVVLILFSFSNEGFLSEEEKLIEEINFSGDSTKNINELYFYEKFEPDIYFCLGKTISDEIYVGYNQIKKYGITTNGSEAMYLSGLALFKKTYYCLEKTEEEGKFYFGFISDNNVGSVNINGEKIGVEYFDYPGNSEMKFGFWFMKTGWDYSINNFSYN